MNRLLGSLTIVALTSTAALSGYAAGSDDERSRTQIVALEREWVDAEANRDASALQRILDDQFVCTFEWSKPIGKADFIQSIVRPHPTETQEISDQKVVVSGDTAIVVETDTDHSVKDGKPRTLIGRVTVTYIKRQGRWRALAEHMAWDPRPPPPNS
jgi:uncharacterized protein (TIGR02246 family)